MAQPLVTGISRVRSRRSRPGTCSLSCHSTMSTLPCTISVMPCSTCGGTARQGGSDRTRACAWPPLHPFCLPACLPAPPPSCTWPAAPTCAAPQPLAPAHLQARVDLEEVELGGGLVHQELHRARRAVLGGRAQRGGGAAQRLAQLRRHQRRGRLLEHLLVPEGGRGGRWSGRWGGRRWGRRRARGQGPEQKHSRAGPESAEAAAAARQPERAEAAPAAGPAASPTPHLRWMEHSRSPRLQQPPSPSPKICTSTWCAAAMYFSTNTPLLPKNASPCGRVPGAGLQPVCSWRAATSQRSRAPSAVQGAGGLWGTAACGPAGRAPASARCQTARRPRRRCCRCRCRGRRRRPWP